MLTTSNPDLGGDGTIDYQTIRSRFEQSGSIGVALGMNQDQIDVLYARAFHLLRGGKADRACSIFAFLCALDDAVTDHWLGYGICLRMRGEIGSALVCFDTAAKLAALSSAPLLHKLELLVREERWDDAQKTLIELDRRGQENPQNAAIVEAAGPFRSALSFRRR